VVLLRRPSDQSKGGNAGTSHERKSKGSKNVGSAAAASSSTPTVSGKQAQKGAGSSSGGGNWKGRKSGWEARFLFKEPEAAGDADTQAAPSSERDTRTTVMIRNIPNKYRYPCLSPHCCNKIMLYFMGAARPELRFC
jgi:hypothetical protein